MSIQYLYCLIQIDLIMGELSNDMIIRIIYSYIEAIQTGYWRFITFKESDWVWIHIELLANEKCWYRPCICFLGSSIYSIPDLRGRSIFQWAWVREIARHPCGGAEVTWLQCEYQTSYCEVGHVAANQESTSLLSEGNAFCTWNDFQLKSESFE